jgi:cytochrome bd-type quinol oxidase subunit 2
MGQKWMAHQRRERNSTRLIWGILYLSLLSILFLSCIPHPAARGAEHTDEATVSLLLKAYEEKVALLQWIGVAVVTALSGAVGLLFRTNLKLQDTIITEVKGVAEVRQQAFEKLESMKDSLDRLVERVERLIGSPPMGVR